MSKPTRKQLVDALCDVLDGTYQEHEIQNETGLEIKRCKEILDIRDAVRGEWVVLEEVD